MTKNRYTGSPPVRKRGPGVNEHLYGVRQYDGSRVLLHSVFRGRCRRDYQKQVPYLPHSGVATPDSGSLIPPSATVGRGSGRGTGTCVTHTRTTTQYLFGPTNS